MSAKSAVRKMSTGPTAKTPKPLSREWLQEQSRDVKIPLNADDAEVTVKGRPVKLTNLQKIFWPELGLTKRDLLQYYLDVSAWLLPHLKNRAMVMKRYPNGISGGFFFMKRAPSPRPSFIMICSIEHGSGNGLRLPAIPSLASP